MSEPIYEAELAQAVGVSRDELRRLREEILTPDRDFVREKNRVTLTVAGVAKLLAHLGLPPAVQPSGSDGEAAADAPVKKTPATVTLHVWRGFPKNKHIIEAYRPGTDPEQWKNRLRVKVRDGSRFTRFDNMGKPLEITCRHLQADFYEIVGPEPKRKGRW